MALSKQHEKLALELSVKIEEAMGDEIRQYALQMCGLCMLNGEVIHPKTLERAMLTCVATLVHSGKILLKKQE